MKSENGFIVQRDGKPLKTPAERIYQVPTQALAEAIAAEWQAQTKKKPDTSQMPMTQLAATCIDIVMPDRPQAVEQVAAFAANELLCYRADHPEDLTVQQAKLWQPVLDWAAVRFGAKLNIGEGIMPIKQRPETLEAFRKAVGTYDDFVLTGLKHAVETSGSFVLGLALTEKHMTVEDVFNAAECDSLFQVEKWGSDPATEARLLSIRYDLDICAEWFKLLT